MGDLRRDNRRILIFIILSNFMLNIALATYFQKIAAGREEMTADLSTEQTINHIAAIIVPLVGGVLWQAYSPQDTFLCGAGVVLAGLALSQYVRTEPASAPAMPALG
jgi:predicted MFS family arabinose efflux permease